MLTSHAAPRRGRGWGQWQLCGRSESFLEPRAQSADWPDPLGCSHTCLSLGSWGLAFHTHWRSGPIESYLSTAGSSRTAGPGTLEGHRDTPLRPFCSSPRDVALSCHRKYPCLSDSLLSLPVGGMLPSQYGTSGYSSFRGAN